MMNRSKNLKIISGVIWILLLLAGDVFAHKVIVYAWVEGDRVFTESKFGSGRKAQNSDLSVFNPRGDLLVSGKTDSKGEFVFDIPEKSPLRVVVEAGPGHRGEWNIPLDEIDQAAPETQAVPPINEGQKTQPDLDRTGAKERLSNLSPEDLAAIEAIMEKKMGPIRKLLVTSQDPGPSARDIFGGIGYILGLVGLGTYVSCRKKQERG